MESPARGLREGWDQAFAEMAKRGDDRLLLPDNLYSSFDETEWEWPSIPAVEPAMGPSDRQAG
jgi:hypothetical protein